MSDPDPMLVSIRLQSSLDDFLSRSMWRGALAEGLATLLFIAVGCGSLVTTTNSIVGIGLCFGLAIATLVWIFGDASGGHINPAVTLAMFLTRRISLVRAVVYIAMQCVGGIGGAAIIRDCLATVPSGFCVNSIGARMTADQGLVVEIVATTVLILTIFAACDKARQDTGGSAALSIGLAVAVCHFAFIPLSGASMNPARSLGPAVMAGDYTNLWIYWVGPMIGSVIAGFSYEFLFCANASPNKLRDFFLEADYNPEQQSNGGQIGAVNPGFTDLQTDVM